MDAFSAAIDLAPHKYEAVLRERVSFAPEELRFRVGRAPALYYGGREHQLRADAVTENDMIRILEKATGASLYNAAEAMRQGYFCVGALRIGICGTVTPGGGGCGFSAYSSLCIRVARERRGICREITDKLLDEGFENTLIIAPPGGGKTTALRELIRLFADTGLRVGVIDERGEIGGGVFDLGRCSDVITGLDKLSAALLLLRSMTPQIVAADEISAPQDIAAVGEIFGCGVGILATAHAGGLQELMKRRAYREMIEKGVFTNLLTIGNVGGERCYQLRKLT